MARIGELRRIGEVLRKVEDAIQGGQRLVDGSLAEDWRLRLIDQQFAELEEIERLTSLLLAEDSAQVLKFLVGELPQAEAEDWLLDAVATMLFVVAAGVAGAGVLAETGYVWTAIGTATGVYLGLESLQLPDKIRQKDTDQLGLDVNWVDGPDPDLFGHGINPEDDFFTGPSDWRDRADPRDFPGLGRS